MKRKQFTFYRSFYEALLRLPEEQRLGVLMAVIVYALDGIEPEGLTDQQEGQFILIRPNLDAAWEKARAGAMGGKASKRGPAEKISKGEVENKIENKIENKTETEAEGFLRFWERYPVKLGRQEALAQWERVGENFHEEDILTGLDRWLGSASWRLEDGRFIPKPEKWLREHWWLQSPRQTVPYGASGRLGKAELEAIEAIMGQE